jgi:hypothetical protein
MLADIELSTPASILGVHRPTESSRSAFADSNVSHDSSTRTRSTIVYFFGLRPRPFLIACFLRTSL